MFAPSRFPPRRAPARYVSPDFETGATVPWQPRSSRFAGDFRILGPLMAFADRLGALHHALLRSVEGVFGFLRLFFDLAGLDKAPLRLIVLPRRGAVALAFVLRGMLSRLSVFGHADLLRLIILC